MKKITKKRILTLALVMGMGVLTSAAQAVTWQPVPSTGVQIPEVEVVTIADINLLASGYCENLNSGTDELQCVQGLTQCVLGEGNRFGCEARGPKGIVYECGSHQGIQYTMETMVQICHENPNPVFKIDASQFIADRRTPLVQIPSQGGNRVGVADPDLILDAARRLHPGPLQVMDDGANQNERDPIENREDVVAANPADGAAEEIIDADSAALGEEITGSGFGCSLGTGLSSNAEVSWMLGLLAAVPLAWPRRQKNSKSPTQGQ